VKGHAGNPKNERCDVLAVEASKRTELEIDKVYEANDDGTGLF
jgi:ribonuclease HI